jgi:hypothetical protein
MLHARACILVFISPWHFLGMSWAQVCFGTAQGKSVMPHFVYFVYMKTLPSPGNGKCHVGDGGVLVPDCQY